MVLNALGTPSFGWALLQDICKHTQQPVRYNVLSHYRADYIYGLQAFRDHTDPIIVVPAAGRRYGAGH